jgi:hypothetical protein
MAAPTVAWFDVTSKDGPALQRFYGVEQFGLTFAFCADPEGHVIGLSTGAMQ